MLKLEEVARFGTDDVGFGFEELRLPKGPWGAICARRYTFWCWSYLNVFIDRRDGCSGVAIVDYIYGKDVEGDEVGDFFIGNGRKAIDQFIATCTLVPERSKLNTKPPCH